MCGCSLTTFLRTNQRVRAPSLMPTDEGGMRHRHSSITIMSGRTDRKECGSSGADIQRSSRHRPHSNPTREKEPTNTIGSAGTITYASHSQLFSRML